MHKRKLSGAITGFAASIIIALFTMPALAQAPDDCRQAPASVPEAARPLSETGLRNLVAFSRLLGYVRHFHPSDQAAGADWDMLAIEGVRRIEPCAGAEQLAAALEAYFRPVAPTVQVFPTGKQPAAPAGLTPPAGATDLKILSWRHVGAGQVTRRGNVYRSERISVPADGRAPIGSQPDQIFTADLGAGISVRVPLKLYADAGGTLPHRAQPVPANPLMLVAQEQTSGNDRATRLAAVALAWNVFQNFYPYFDVVETDWPGALTAALTGAASDKDERAFLDTLRRLVAALHDGHGGVYHSRIAPLTDALPLAWTMVDDKLVITRAIGEAADAGLKAGDVVLAIDGEPTEQVMSRLRAVTSAATPQWARYYILTYHLQYGPKGSAVRLNVQSPGAGQREVVLHRSGGELKEQLPSTVAELEPGIFYFDIDRASDEDLDAAVPKLAEAKAVIFDMRGYPNKTNDFLHYLSDDTLESAIWQIPIVTRPDRQGVPEYDSSGRWELLPFEPRIKGRIIFMSGGGAISNAESVMGIIEAYHLADIVGETTAGTNGNINPFAVPGGYVLSWTGMRVLKHDGSRHHGVGISPTVPASRTVKGIAEGRDEILEKALELARTPRP